MNSHLTPQQMLAFIDGELSKAEARHVDEHLHSCWTCLTEVDRLKNDIATILDAHHESFGPALPTPPKPWLSIEALIAKSVPPAQASPWARFTMYLDSAFTPLRLLLFSAAFAVLLVCALTVFHAMPVSAKATFGL